MIEPIIINGVNKDVSPGGLDYSGRKILNPIRDVLNARYLSSEGSDEYQVESIRGTTEVTFAWPAGINECIGTYENLEKNLMIFWYWNSNGYHAVYKYDQSTDTISQLLVDNPSSPVLNFSRSPQNTITGAGMVGDILTWTDNLNPQRYLNITRTYSTINDFTLSLYKIAPRTKPQIAGQSLLILQPDKDSDSSVIVNRIADNSFQFAFYYVYVDNEYSALSPWSDLVLADAYGADKSFKNSRNKTQVTFTIDTDVIEIIKRVELCYRIGNTANWYVWKKYESFGSTIAADFFNDSPGETVPASQAAKISESIPNYSRALTVLKGRVFLNINEEGMEMPALTITPTLGPDIDVNSVSSFAVFGGGTQRLAKGIRGLVKKNGLYSIGVVGFDGFGRSTGVYVKAKISGKDLSISPTAKYPASSWPRVSDASNVLGNKINVALSGSVNRNSRYSIVLSDELNYESYLQTQVRVYGYISEFDGTYSTGNPFVINNKLYTSNLADTTKYSFLHLFLPVEIPFLPTTDYYVRMVSRGNQTIVEKVLEVFGNVVVTGKFIGLTFHDTDVHDVEFVEIFKLRQTPKVFYREINGPRTSTDGTVDPSISNIEADTFYRGMLDNAHDDVIDNNLKHFRFQGEAATISGGTANFLKLEYENTVVETPSPVYITGGSTEITKPSKAFINTVFALTEKGYTPDYSKPAWSGGRPFVEAKPEILHRPSTLRFSDVYIEGSNINGLNSFGVENIYDKIGQDRSPITKLISAGNILVAVHERHLSSLYIGEGIVRSGETGFLSKVDDVIGDDRKLIGDMGSYHPESVQEVDGQVFGYDIYTGVVWRYTVEGVYAISNFGMKSYFRDRSRSYIDSRNELKFVSSIDRYHKEYLLTMPAKYSTLFSAPVQNFTLSTGQYDLVLDPDDYIEGDVYRVRIELNYMDSQSVDDVVTVGASFDGVTTIKSGLTMNVPYNGYGPVLYIEFTYGGEGYIRLSFTGMDHGIAAAITSEEQEVKGETWAFNYEKKLWTQRYSMVPEYLGKIGNQVIAFKDGRLWKCNDSDTYNNFFDVQYERSYSFSVNPQPNKVHTWAAIQIAAESVCEDETSTFRIAEFSNGNEQESYTRAKDFDKKEGVYYAPIFKDINTNPDLLAAGRIALRDGKDMRSKTLECVINNNRTDRSLLQKINVVYEDSEFSI